MESWGAAILSWNLSWNDLTWFSQHNCRMYIIKGHRFVIHFTLFYIKYLNYICPLLKRWRETGQNHRVLIGKTQNNIRRLSFYLTYVWQPHNSCSLSPDVTNTTHMYECAGELILPIQASCNLIINGKQHFNCTSQHNVFFLTRHVPWW